MQKRGQITTSIVIGIILLIVSGLALYLSADLFEKKAELKEALETPLIKQSVRPFIESCIKSEAENAVFLLGFQGGYIWLPENQPSIITSYSEVPYWFYNSVSIPPTKEVIETQISNYIDSFTPFCILGLEIPGYEVLIDAEKIYTKTIIKDENVLIDTNLPVKLKKQGSELSINRFLVELPVNLDKILNVSDQVIDMFEEDPTSIDLTYLSELPLEATVYNFDVLDKVITILDDDANVKGDEFYQFSFAVKMVKPFNSPPILGEIPLITAKVGEEITFTIQATDPDGQTLKYSSISHLFEINEDTGVITFIAEEAGRFAPIVEVEDPYGETDYSTILIAVTG